MSHFNPQYKTIKCSDLTAEVIHQCSELFSGHYGKYSGKDHHTKGERIRLKGSFYERLKENENMYVSLCFNNELLLGHAFFLRKEILDKGYCSWITQLVVHSSYRNRRIGSKLLQSAWGFSNDYAWGVATTNSITIKTLESVTYRDVNIPDMKANVEVIKLLSDEIEFANKDYIIFNDKRSQINTQFFPEIEMSKNKDIQDKYKERLGEIMDGHEWLAFTFKTQPFVGLDEDKLHKLLDFSTHQLKEAYGRMDMPNQLWTQGTGKEVDYIIDRTGLQRGKVLDFGCGFGRHCVEFSKRGYDVTGIDFSEALIEKASKHINACTGSLRFIHDDCRKYSASEPFDLILCLYDVIGSFREEKENLKIIANIYHNLKTGGKAVVSVMNMELTEFLAIHKTSIKNNPEELLKLEASTTMARSGDVFKPNYYLIDTDSNLVFRKEQFNQDGFLSAEYVLADKRYTKDEISTLFANAGFKINLAIYVQAGKWDVALEATNQKAKEILLIVEKT